MQGEQSYRNILNNRTQANDSQRRVFDRGYLATLEDSKMRLTDDPIAEIKSNSIVTRSGEEVHVDAIVSITKSNPYLIRD